jgi:hypothetical protein
MKPARPKHCKGCVLFHSANRQNPTGGLEKYNAWCCAKGDFAEKSIGFCKSNNLKKINSTNTGERE